MSQPGHLRQETLVEQIAFFGEDLHFVPEEYASAHPQV
jgi:hypothetical protein